MSRVTRFSVSILITFFMPALLVTAQRAPSPVPSRLIALTFDDGPKPVATRALQSVLRKHDASATFFVVGKMAQRFPAQVKSLLRDGHEIASHTWSHPNIRSISPKRLKLELKKTKDLLETLTGRKSNLFRTPGSTLNYLRKRFQVPAGYRLVLWDVHSLDHKGLDSNEIVDRIVPQAQDGDIVLLHNGLESTTEAMECLLLQLKSLHFEFVTVSELLRRKGPHHSVVSG